MGREMDNILKDIGFMIRHDIQLFHFTSIAMWCPPSPYRIFNNQIHGGFQLLPQNIVKKNRANNPKTFHQTETQAFQQYPKGVAKTINSIRSFLFSTNRKSHFSFPVIKICSLA